MRSYMYSCKAFRWRSGLTTCFSPLRYESEIFPGNSREMWRNINQIIGKTSKTTNITSVKTNDIILTNKVDITETFNYFSNIEKELSSHIPHSNKGFE